MLAQPDPLVAPQSATFEPGATAVAEPPTTLTAEFEQRIRAQMFRSITIAHVSTLATGLISIAGSSELRRRPRAWASLAVSGVQSVMAHRAMLRGDFGSPRVAGGHAVCAALNQELMPTLRNSVGSRERCWVRYQAIWFSAMNRAGGNNNPGFWAAVAHVPIAARALRGEKDAISHLGGHAAWLTFLRAAMTDALLNAPRVLKAIDKRTNEASTLAAEQATRDALSIAVAPLLDHMRRLRSSGANLDRADRIAQCQTMLTEAAEVCDQTARTADEGRHDQDLFEVMLSDLQRRSDRTTTVSYGVIIADSLLSLLVDLRHRDVSRLRALASAAITVGSAWRPLRDPPPFMRGELQPGSVPAAVRLGLAIGSSALVLHGAPAEAASFDNYDRLTYMSAGIGSDNRSVILPTAIAAVIGLPTMCRMQPPGERVFVLGHAFGVGLGTSLALNNFFRGLAITNQAAADSRQLLVADARAQATRRATLWAQLAAHDYVKQTARFLLNNPDTPLEQFEEVLDDAIRQLEAGLDSSFRQLPQRSNISELVTELAGAYRRLDLDPAVVLDLADPVSPEVERAVLTAVNQGLANVLAHTNDPRPVIRVTTAEGGAQVEITNRRQQPSPLGSGPPGTGFRLLDAALNPVGGIRTLRTDAHCTVLRVRIPSGPPANEHRRTEGP